jgi:hypothetical protein
VELITKSDIRGLPRRLISVSSFASAVNDQSEIWKGEMPPGLDEIG